MNKQKLIDAVEKLSIQAHRSPEEQFFITILRTKSGRNGAIRAKFVEIRVRFNQSKV